MKDITELINLLTSKSNVLITRMVVAAIVLVIFLYGWLEIEPPYVA